MKIKIITIAILFILVGCSDAKPANNDNDVTKSEVEANTTDANNDRLETAKPGKVISAADVKVDAVYDFAYSDEPIENYVTFKSGNSITITSKEPVSLVLYSSASEIHNLSEYDMYEVILNEENDYKYVYNNEQNYTYFQLSAMEESEVVISTM